MNIYSRYRMSVTITFYLKFLFGFLTLYIILFVWDNKPVIKLFLKESNS